MTDLELADQTVFIPRSVGPYRVQSELGAGAMGTVFRAVHTGLERAVALKVLRPEMLQDPDSVRRFLREARSIARLEHPHIVSVYDAGEIDGIYYIAMKLLEGETLQALLARTVRLPAERVVRLGSQLASALDYAHAREVVHLDVKPANVIVARDFATLTDFSIAQALNPGATRSATISGTPLYMSPEQIQGKDVDSRSDIYSLGLLLYEMCVGSPPFQGPFVTVMYAHLHHPIPDVREQAPGISDSLAAVIDRALAKDRRARFQTAGEMLRALERCVDDSTVSVAHTVVLAQPDAEVAPQALPEPDVAPSVEASTSVETLTAAVAEEQAALRSWRRPRLMAGGIVAIAAIATGAFFLRPQPATAGALSIATAPAGASVAVDGKSQGQAPLDLTKIHSGQHTISVSAPTYFSKQVPVTVTGGQTSKVTVSLASWPIKRLVSVTAVLATSVHKDASGSLQVSGVVKQISAAQAKDGSMHAVAELQLAPAAVGQRTLRVTPQYLLYGPDGLLIRSFRTHFPVLTLSQTSQTLSFSTGIQLNPNSRRLPPQGAYQLELLVNNQGLKTLSFQVTR